MQKTKLTRNKITIIKTRWAVKAQKNKIGQRIQLTKVNQIKRRNKVYQKKKYLDKVCEGIYQDNK